MYAPWSLLSSEVSWEQCVQEVLSQALLYTPHTIIKQDGYSDYACPENGRTIQKHQDVFDNKHVVPHSRELLVQFDCHINLKVCGSIKAVKYIHRYIYKDSPFR